MCQPTRPSRQYINDILVQQDPRERNEARPKSLADSLDIWPANPSCCQACMLPVLPMPQII